MKLKTKNYLVEYEVENKVIKNKKSWFFKNEPKVSYEKKIKQVQLLADSHHNKLYNKNAITVFMLKDEVVLELRTNSVIKIEIGQKNTQEEYYKEVFIDMFKKYNK